MGYGDEELLAAGAEPADLSLLQAPSKEEMDKLDPVYVSYFVEWNSYKNYELAKRWGFRDLTHELDRTHHVENFDQIESPAYLIHPWLKYPKFGHASATDYCARTIRYGMMTREEAIQKVKEHDHALDPRSIRDFCDFLGYTTKEFWDIIDKLYNKDIFEKNKIGQWVLKDPIWNQK